MSSVDILYIIIGTCIVVITVAFVWLANEAMALIKSLKISAKNTETISEELKEKTMLVSESLDRVGTVATRVISFVEDMESAVEEKAGAIASSIGVIAGAKKYFVDGKRESKPESKLTEDRADKPEIEVVEPKSDKKVQEEKVEEKQQEPTGEPTEEATEIKVKPDRQKAQEVEVEVD